MNPKNALIFTYAHLPEKLMFLENPPKDVTFDKYSNIPYLERVLDMVKELKNKEFVLRRDKVLPYSKKVIVNHFKNRIRELKQELPSETVEKPVSFSQNITMPERNDD